MNPRILLTSAPLIRSAAKRRPDGRGTALPLGVSNRTVGRSSAAAKPNPLVSTVVDAVGLSWLRRTDGRHSGRANRSHLDEALDVRAVEPRLTGLPGSPRTTDPASPAPQTSRTETRVHRMRYWRARAAPVHRIRSHQLSSPHVGFRAKPRPPC